MGTETLRLKLKIWRQAGPQAPGRFEEFDLDNVSTHCSFLEMLDILNEKLVKDGVEPIEVESDCREGICGTCGLFINGQAHGPDRGTAVCQLHMRRFQDGQTIVIEPWRAKAFPVIRDLVVDRSALDRIIQAGGYVSTKSGPHADANCLLVPQPDSEKAMDNAACIGCGACVAACPNASASLFTAAKVTHLAYLPQGKVEAPERVEKMVQQMDQEGFGHCTNLGECESACPKEIPLESIRTLKMEYLKAILRPHVKA